VGRDGVGEVTPSLENMRSARDAECGLRLRGTGWAPRAIVDQGHSAWAKRLAVGGRRRAVLARDRRVAS